MIFIVEKHIDMFLMRKLTSGVFQVILQRQSKSSTLRFEIISHGVSEPQQ